MKRGRETGFSIWLSTLIVLLAMGPGGVSEVSAEPDADSPGTVEFVGKNVFATANGTFHDWRVVEQRVDPGALAGSFVLVEISLASVDTGSKRRDAHLRNEDFFEVERFPKARVRVHSPRPLEPGESGRARFSLRFDLDLHGVQKTLEGEAEVSGEDPLVFEGDLIVDRLDFGVGSAHSRWNPMSIRPEIPVHFRVEL
ncbi:MAG: hypothetical protein CL908_07760 [Deltaproteobacteria bacterium]|jgi:polyisoprenoid-binding protein YceI|nr:hypothetical protein [Deltaproteobacteria bacterium]